MARHKRANPVHGWVNFDKPVSVTSAQAVSKVCWFYGAQKAGHAGTLDPLASGILPIALGEATKTVPFLVKAAKTYEVGISWGISTNTLDAEGEVTATSDVRPTGAELAGIVGQFVGEIEQIPPVFSAIKINGVRAYDLARAGKRPEMKARTVCINGIEVLEAHGGKAILRVDCSKGTYIRALVRDIAIGLQADAHVRVLRRTRVGPLEIDTAFSLDNLEDLHHKGRVLDGLLPVSTALDDIPALAVTDQEQTNLKQGRVIVPNPTALAGVRGALKPRSSGKVGVGRYVLATYRGVEVALCEARAGCLSPKRVFNL